jgi:translation elongation factor EF-1beta
MAIMDVMETCTDAAVMSDVVANDISDGITKLKLTVIVADGKNGSCVVSGKKKRGV